MSVMARVGAKFPCPICKKPDWCLVGKSVIICMRVRSTKPKTMSDGSVGYVHIKDGSQPAPPVESRSRKPAPVTGDFPGLLKEWAKRLGPGVSDQTPSQLGVSPTSLATLQSQRAPWTETVAFPMRNGSNAIVGIRLRNRKGMKWAISGSHQGLFIPQCDPGKVVYLVEGPTNTAAALTIGAFAVGRPNNCGGVFDIKELIKRLAIRQAVIVADTDKDKFRPDGSNYNPGADGACSLSEHLGIPHCILLLPVKDMRDFVAEGGTLDTLSYLTSQCVWRR